MFRQCWVSGHYLQLTLLLMDSTSLFRTFWSMSSVASKQWRLLRQPTSKPGRPELPLIPQLATPHQQSVTMATSQQPNTEGSQVIGKLCNNGSDFSNIICDLKYYSSSNFDFGGSTPLKVVSKSIAIYISWEQILQLKMFMNT